MLSHYLLLPGKVLLRRKFFTFLSLFGISFTLAVLTLAVALLDATFAPQLPEVHQARTLQLDWADMRGDGYESCCSPGFKLLDLHARSLPGVERLSIYTGGAEVFSYVDGRKLELFLKRTDAEFWNILRFNFVEGGPYSGQDVDDAAFVAVLNATMRREFFGNGEAIGQTIDAGGQRFRVVGVVDDVPSNRRVPYADIWVPYTTTRGTAYRTGLMGNFKAIALAADAGHLADIRQEFNARMKRVEFDDPQRYNQMVAPFETKFDAFARRSFLADDGSEAPQGWRLILLFAGAALLFALLPTVNLINLGVSRILERQAEIGVRKAFGASSATLVGQFVVENVVLTAVGGAFGLLTSFALLRAVNNSGLIKYAQLTVNPRVFAYALLITLLFALLSGVYPAWRMSRLHPSTALKGSDRR